MQHSTYINCIYLHITQVIWLIFYWTTNYDNHCKHNYLVNSVFLFYSYKSRFWAGPIAVTSFIQALQEKNMKSKKQEALLQVSQALACVDITNPIWIHTQFIVTIVRDTARPQVP